MKAKTLPERLAAIQAYLTACQADGLAPLAIDAFLKGIEGNARAARRENKLGEQSDPGTGAERVRTKP